MRLFNRETEVFFGLHWRFARVMRVLCDNSSRTSPRCKFRGQAAELGFSLIELIIFIIILGILGSGFTLSFIISLQKVPEVSRATAINTLLEERMTAIVGQKVFKGFSAVQNLCPSAAAICQEIIGYPAQVSNLNVTINNWENDTHLKWITVKYLNEGDGLQAIVADY